VVYVYIIYLIANSTQTLIFAKINPSEKQETSSTK